MGKFVNGDIVVINFPFSDLTGAKRRPALVVADLDGDDIILCQITGQSKMDKHTITLGQRDFVDGSLKAESAVRPNKLFTADKNVILYTACKITNDKFSEVIDGVIKLIKPNPVSVPTQK